jgi:hypothetical protein
MSISIPINKNEKFQQVQENQRPVLSFQETENWKIGSVKGAPKQEQRRMD